MGNTLSDITDSTIGVNCFTKKDLKKDLVDPSNKHFKASVRKRDLSGLPQH